MSDATRTVEREGIAFAVEEHGDGTPIVLLHGLTATRRYVLHGSRTLEGSGFRTLGFDARGHGDTSPAPDDTYTYALLAADVVAMMDAAGIARGVLMGVSMGSATALRVALEYPDRVSGLVVVTPAHRGHPSTNLNQWDARADGFARGGVDGFIEALGELPGDDSVRRAILTMVRQRMGRHRHPEAVAACLRQIPRDAAFDGIEALAGVQAPCLIVGSRDRLDPEHPLAVSEEYARTVPHARLVVEDEDQSPLAWRGGSLSRVVADYLTEQGLA